MANVKIDGKVDLTKWEFELPDWIKPAGLLEHISQTINDQFESDDLWIYEFAGMYGEDDSPEATTIRVVLPWGDNEDEPAINLSVSHCVDMQIDLIQQGFHEQEGFGFEIRLRDELRALAQRIDDAIKIRAKP